MEKKAVGYTAINELLQLKVLPHYRESYILKKGRGKTIVDNHHEVHLYPKSYALKNESDLLEHLEFALKYDGMNLAIIKGLFENIEKEKVEAYIKAHPTSIYARKIWFLYEFLLNEQLSVSDSKMVKYVNLLDPEKYFTNQHPIKSTRHAINNNLLGDRDFCPLVRRTERLNGYIESQLNEKAKDMLNRYDPYIISRASNYLYTKETMSSFEIEREQPDKTRLTKFVGLLQQASSMGELSKQKLIELQNVIVDPRFKDVDYRVNQNYIGENISPYFQKIHYISPKPVDVEVLMQGWFLSLNKMLTVNVHPVVIASITAFGFVFIHPFEDGNGRIHRFLIHYVLSRTGFSPKDVIFPVSSVMLKKIHEYDETLESISKPLMQIITDYDLSEDGILQVNQETRSLYQYPDYTVLVEYLFACLQETIDKDFEKEIMFLINYDKAKQEVQKIIDMPDNKIDLLIRCVLQNNGKLSAPKRNKFFDLLTDEEVSQLTSIIWQTMSRAEPRANSAKVDEKDMRGIMAGANTANIRDRDERNK